MIVALPGLFSYFFFIITPGQEANGYNLGVSFDEAILMTSNNIHFNDKDVNIPLKISIIFCFLGLSMKYPRDSKTCSNKP